jgi:hypothetical protein
MHCTLPRSPSRSAREAITCKAVAEDHAVGPVGRAGRTRSWRLAGQAVEVGEQVELLGSTALAFLSLGWPQQVINQHLGVDLFLDVERRGVHDQVGPVLLILAAPDQLRVQVAVAALIGHADGLCCSLSITDWYSAVGMFLRALHCSLSHVAHMRV